MCAAQYEVMRAEIIGSMPRASHGVGLAVLMRQGLAAWIDAVRQCALPGRRSPQPAV
jgi:hypothetical protein